MGPDSRGLTQAKSLLNRAFIPSSIGRQADAEPDDGRALDARASVAPSPILV